VARLDGLLNPMLVRDVRCWLRSKFFLVVFFLAMAASQISVCVAAYASKYDEDSAQVLFTVLLAGMSFVLVGVLPYMIKDRFDEELASRMTDLTLISRMSAGQIVRGKILSGLAASLLFFAALGPSLMLAYMLGGIDPLLLAYSLLLLLACAVTAMMLAVLIAALLGRRRARILGLIFPAAGIGTLILQVAVIHEGQRGHMFHEEGFWLSHAMGLIVLVPLLYFLYAVAAARLSFPAENRASRPRLALAALVLLTLLSVAGLPPLFTYLGWLSRSINLTMPAVISALVGVLVGALMVLDTPAKISRRVLARWPRSGIWRTLFCPGPGRVRAFLLFCFAMLIGASFFCFGGRKIFSSHWVDFKLTVTTVLMGLTLLGVSAGVAGLLRRISLLGKVPLGIMTFGVMIVWGVVAIICPVLTEVADFEREFLLLSPPSGLGYIFDGHRQQDERSTIAFWVYFFPAGVVVAFWLAAAVRAAIENGRLAAERRRLEEARAARSAPTEA
jgi:hypothetical protein